MCWIADRFISFAAIVVTVARPLALSLAAGISLTFAIGLTRSLAQAEGGMDCTRELFMLGNCANILLATCDVKSDGSMTS